VPNMEFRGNLSLIFLQRHSASSFCCVYYRSVVENVSEYTDVYQV
jgi:hypothetical protein